MKLVKFLYSFSVISVAIFAKVIADDYLEEESTTRKATTRNSSAKTTISTPKQTSSPRLLMTGLNDTTIAPDQLEKDWKTWRSHYEASSPLSRSLGMEQVRFENFKRNRALVFNHNEKRIRGEVDFELKLNEMADLDQEQVAKYKQGFVKIVFEDSPKTEPDSEVESRGILAILRTSTTTKRPLVPTTKPKVTAATQKVTWRKPLTTQPTTSTKKVIVTTTTAKTSTTTFPFNKVPTTKTSTAFTGRTRPPLTTTTTTAQPVFTTRTRPATAGTTTVSTTKRSSSGSTGPVEPRLPSALDWRSRGIVGPVRYQGGCGACWAFAAAGALESRLHLRSRRFVQLSPQNLIDCSRLWGTWGCSGGDPIAAFSYANVTRGINSEAMYPYAENDYNSCSFSSTAKFGALDVGEPYTLVDPGSEEALMEALQTGPVAVAIDASQPSFTYYSSGIYSDPECDPFNLTHAVLLVGYGFDPRTRKPFWIVRNSWGAEWGENGFFRIARNAGNMCGIASYGIYPNIAI